MISAISQQRNSQISVCGRGLLPTCVMAAMVAMVAFSSQFSYAQKGKYTDMIAHGGVLAPTDSALLGRASSVGGVVSLVAGAFSAFNQHIVFGKLRENWNTTVTEALKMAADKGHSGVLVQINVVQYPAQNLKPQYHLIGSGVAIRGTGMSADDVCFSGRCDASIGPDVSPGARPTPISGAYWVEPSKEGGKLGFIVKSYDIGDLAANARRKRNNSLLRESYAREVSFREQDGYLSELKDRARTTEHLARVDALEQSLKKTRERLAQIDKQLAEELERERRRSEAAASIAKFKGVLELATTLAMAEAISGEKLADTAGKAPKTAAEAQVLADAIAEKSRQAVQDIKLLHLEQRRTINGVTTEIKMVGSSLEMKDKN